VFGCPLGGLQKLVFVRLDIHSVGHFHHDRSGHTRHRNKFRACDDDPTQRNLQLSVTQEVVGSLSETGEEAASVFAQIAVESRYGVHVEEFVEESTTSSPMGSVTIYSEVP